MRIKKFETFTSINESFFDSTLTSEDVEDLFLGICDVVGVRVNSSSVRAMHQFVDKNGRVYNNINTLHNAKGVTEYKNFYQFFITVPKRVGVNASNLSGIKSNANDSLDNMMGNFADHIQNALNNLDWVEDNNDDFEEDDIYGYEDGERNEIDTNGVYFNDANKFKEIANEIVGIERKIKAKDMQMYFTGFFIGGTINFFILDNKFSKIDKNKKDELVNLKEIITTINYRIPSDYNKFRMVDTDGNIYVLCIDSTVSMLNVDAYLTYIKSMFNNKYKGYNYKEIKDFTIRYETRGNYITNRTRGLEDTQAESYMRMGYMPIVKIQITKK